MWIKAVAVNTANIEPASPGENGCCESFNGRMRDKSRNGEVFNPLPDAPVIIEQ
jgi:putative transposase